ncbi:MAG: DUF1365 domain-containing protein [Phycisphaerales bacterium]|nr:DUF1365 domain-containing protein [Phycisphaerales bacterium]
MNSQIYKGETTHCRHMPRKHAFKYRMFWMGIDLDELPSLDRNLSAFGYNRSALVSIYDLDYGGPGEGDLNSRIRKILNREGVHEPIDRIKLMTIPRIAGYVFNPVSFYLCTDPDGSIRILIAEVRNTFGEMHHYVTKLENIDPGSSENLQCTIPKKFYVSPFLRVDGEYKVRLRQAENEFSISISLFEENKCVLSASMMGEGKELNTKNLNLALLRFPFFALTIMTRIHLQALKLFFARGLRMSEKPAPSHPSTVPASHIPWWMRLRTALVRSAAHRRPPLNPDSQSIIPTKDSQ